MTYEEFKAEVFKTLEKDFHFKMTEEEVAKELPEYEDIINEGKRSIYGEKSGIRYAANNIAMIL